MTYPEIDAMIGEVGLPYAYYQFPETGQQPPFICWMLDGISDLHADNINYQRIVVLAVELYTDEKDFVQEAAVEAVFASHGMGYGKAEQYIDSEHMHETVYTMEVVING
jgi:hypothetical protein